VVNFVDAWSDSRAEHANVAELREESARLQKRIAALGEDDAAERAARKSGMWAEGEGAYVIEGLRK
jgi:cell division protein FtsB